MESELSLLSSMTHTTKYAVLPIKNPAPVLLTHPRAGLRVVDQPATAVSALPESSDFAPHAARPRRASTATTLNFMSSPLLFNISCWLKFYRLLIFLSSSAARFFLISSWDV